jgi:hypothetical protein
MDLIHKRRGRYALLSLKEAAEIKDFLNDKHISLSQFVRVCGIPLSNLWNFLQIKEVYIAPVRKIAAGLESVEFPNMEIFNQISYQNEQITPLCNLLEEESRINRKKGSPAVYRETLCWRCKYAYATGCEKFIKGGDYCIPGSKITETAHFNFQGQYIGRRVDKCPKFEEGRVEKPKLASGSNPRKKMTAGGKSSWQQSIGKT